MANTVCTIEARKCACGAITVIDEDGTDYSMPEETFMELFPYQEITGSYCNCNYCVNHWGIDLCGCGSGEKVGECTNGYEECKNHIPAQELGMKKERVLWR